MPKTTFTVSILALSLAAPLALAEVEGSPEMETPATAQDGTTAVPQDGTATVTEDGTTTVTEAAPPPLTGSVARATFTSDVLDREPQDSVSRVESDESKIIFFTELRDLDGHTVTHVWERNGVEMARVPFSVGADRWRVYSVKTLKPGWLGEWTVRVVDEHDRVLHSEAFQYVAATTPPVEEETPETTEPTTLPASMPME